MSSDDPRSHHVCESWAFSDPHEEKVERFELLSLFWFTDTHFGWECLGDKNLKNYNGIYHEVEKAENLYAVEGEISEDDADYKSDLLLIKASSLHKIAAKLEVFPYKELFYKSLTNCVLEKGILGSPAGNVSIISGSVFFELYKMPQPDMVYNADSTKAFLKGKDIVKTTLKDWACNPNTFKKRAHLDYPISHFRRGIRIGMMLLNKLYGAANIDHVNQYWIPLLGEIIMNDRKPDLLEAITGDDMPKTSEAVRKDLKLIGAWWYFQDATIIRVEGTLIPPTTLPLYVHDRLVALEVARQCNYGMARTCKTTNQKPYPFLPFKIDKGVIRCWDPYSKVKEHLKSIQDKVGIVYQHQISEEDQFYLCPEDWEEVEFRIRYAQESLGTSSQTHAKDVAIEEADAKETNEVIKQKLLSGLPTRLLEVQLPSTSIAATVSTLALSTTSTSNSSVTGSSSVGPNIAITPPGSRSSPIPPIPSPLPTSSSLSSTTVVPEEEEVHKSLGMETTLSFDLIAGIKLPPFFSLKPSLRGPFIVGLPTPPLSLTSPLTISQSALDTSAAISVPTPAFTPPTTTGSWEYQLRSSLSASKASIALGFSDPFFTTKESTMTLTTISSTLSQSQVATPPASSAQAMSKQEWIQMQLAKVKRVDTTTPRHPNNLEYDKSTSSLKRFTKRRIKTREQVALLQTKENLLSLTRKRKRGTKAASIDDRVLVVDPVSIVRSANKMFEEAIERMQKELLQAHDKIAVEEAKTKGNETHHKIQSSLSQIGEWEAKLATLGNVPHRNILPNVPLLSLDEVVTCENVLAKTKQVLEDGDTPLVTSNNHLELSSQNILSLFASAGLPQVMKQDGTLCAETEFEATLGDFVDQFSKNANGPSTRAIGMFMPPHLSNYAPTRAYYTS
eukprot:Gb_01042 [translate_table: standard]